MNEALQSRPPFKVAGLAAINHLNVRKEGPEDDKILAVDLKLQFSNVDRRLCAYFDDALEAFLWRGETNALIVRNEFLSPVVYGNAIGSASVRIGLHSFQGCEVKKFSIEPRDGGVIHLGCSVSLYPTAGEVSDLAKLVQDEDQVSIEGPPDLFAVDPGQSEDSREGVAGDRDAGAFIGDSEQDPMYEQAVAIVKQSRKGSISLVQRHLRIGYNRAARLLERMEGDGIVSAMNSSGAREVLAA